MTAALVAVLALCALAPACSGADVQQYDLDMRTGDVFTYAPETSLPAKLDFASEQDWATWNEDNTEMTVVFDEPVKERQLLIRAVWTSETGGLTQTAYQAINFRAFGHVTIDGKSALDIQRAVPSGTGAGTIVYAPTVNEVEGTVTNLTCQIPENPYIGWDSSRNAIVVKDTVSATASKEIVCAITAENVAADEGSTLRPEVVSATVIVSIGADFVITSASSYETYRGSPDSSYAITTNYDSDGIEITRAVSGDYPEGLACIEDGKVRIDTSKAVLGSEDSVTYTVTVTVQATVDGELRTATKDIQVTVWRDQSFMDAPTISNVVAEPGDTNADVALSATISHATHVIVDWGDGSDVQRIAGDGDSYSKNHTYSDAKAYVITLTAVNAGKGATVHYVLYNAADGGSITDYEPPAQPEERDESLLWLLFAVLAVALALTYATYYNDVLVIGFAVISALVSVTLYIGWL